MHATWLNWMIVAQEKVTGAMEATPFPAPGAAPAATPTPIPPATPAPGPGIGEIGKQVGGEAVGFFGKIAGFFQNDFFPNLGMYLTLFFMCVLAILIFIGINISVRFIVDPIVIKLFRLEESSKFPSLVGGAASIALSVVAFQWIYETFTAIQPPIQFLLQHFR